MARRSANGEEMTDVMRERMNVGRRLLGAAPKLAARVGAFHAWMISAAQEMEPKHVMMVVEDGCVVAVQTPLGRFEVAEELARVELELMARIVFFRAPTALRKDPQEVYSIRVFADGATHFGPGPDPDDFDLDDWQDGWLPRNMTRLAYELAAAAVPPRR
jgi:hypothetical protein